MKKLAISLVALAAMSTASFATYRDITTPEGSVDEKQKNTGVIITDDAFAVPNAAYDKAGDELELGGSNRN
jgi:hypothetical protein